MFKLCKATNFQYKRNLSIWANRCSEVFIILISISNLFLQIPLHVHTEHFTAGFTSGLAKVRQMPTSTDKRQSSDSSEKASNSWAPFPHKAKFKRLHNKTEITLTCQLYLRFITDSNFLEISS